MAFIYRYKLDNRKDIDLRDFEKEIVEIIKDFFGIEYRSILKDIKLGKEYFEYRLHLAPDTNILVDINMRVEMLLAEKNKRGQVELKKINNKYIGFIQEEYIGLEHKEITSIELLDYEYCKELDSIEKIKDLDTFSLRFKDRDMTYFFSDSKEFEEFVAERFLIVEGNYGSNYNYPKITGFLDKDFLEKYEEVDKEIYGRKNHITRNFTIRDIRKPKKSEKDIIQNMSKIFLEFDKTIEPLDKDYLKNTYDKKDIGGFSVYDTGQALRAAVSNVDKSVEIYFDMGIDKNADILNYEKKIELLRNKKVILSHIHLDHWHMLNVDIDAFYQDYYIRDQEKGFIFSKRCAEIIGGDKEIKYIEDNIELDFGKIYVGCHLDGGAARLHKHETGLYIEVSIKDKKILFSGDHRYECMEKIEDLDILVASHHGGEYSRDGRGNKEDIPLAKDGEGLVIYSYGENNPYGHPNKKEDHINRGWTREHHTPIEGDYIL